MPFLSEALEDGEVAAFVDSNPQRWGERFEGYEIVAPESIRGLEWDEIVISCTATVEVYKYLRRLGIPASRIRAAVASDRNRQRWDEMRNAHRQERIFIVGNGPSLRISDLERIGRNQELSFGFNKIYLAFDQTEYRPTFYLVEDNLVARNCREQIKGLTGFTKFYADYLIPVLGPPDEESILFNFSVQEPETFSPKFSTEPLLIHSGYTCTYSAIQLALWMGCNPIILVGVDFWFRPAESDSAGRLVHSGEQNHFLPNYRQEGEIWNPPYLEQTERAYALARDVAAERGVEILNATRGGYLETFVRVGFDDLFV